MNAHSILAEVVIPHASDDAEQDQLHDGQRAEGFREILGSLHLGAERVIKHLSDEDEGDAVDRVKCSTVRREFRVEKKQDALEGCVGACDKGGASGRSAGSDCDGADTWPYRARAQARHQPSKDRRDRRESGRHLQSPW